MERNVTLDFVRGVAILGILLLNISAFGLPKAAYLNPAPGQEARPLAMPRTGAPRPAGAGEVSHPVRAAVWRRSSAIASREGSAGSSRG